MKSACLALAFSLALSAPASDPLAEMSQAPVDEVALTGKLLAEIEGDFVHPAFSPDGRRLAYSRVVVKDGTELCEVLVRDLATSELITLLDSESSRRYAMYSSFVTGIRWQDENVVEAGISDGDVGWTLIRFDISETKILSEDARYADEELFELTPEGEALLARAQRAFPSWRPELLENVVLEGLRLGDGIYIGQKQYVDEDYHIWQLDLGRAEAVRILELPVKRYDLWGGFVWRDWLVLQLRDVDRLHLLLRHEEQWRRVGPLLPVRRGVLEVKHSSPVRALFIVKLHRRLERGDNPLFILDEDGLRRLTGTGELYDVAVDPAGKKICLVVWQEGQRHLIIRDLSLK